MNILFCIFLILASLVCLATLTWVTRDIILDAIDRKKKTSEISAVIVEEPEEETAYESKEETAEEFEEETADEPEEETVDEPEEEIAREVIEEEALIPETVITDIGVEQDTTSVEVVDIVWDEHIGKNKTYRYAPNGFEVGKGDIVLVPTFSSQRHGEIARKATVHSDVYKIDPAEQKYHLKPILRVMQKAASVADVAETPAE